MYSPNGLGFSLKPPAWIKNIVGAAFKGTTVTVPTPSGTLSVDISDPSQVNMLKNMILGTKIGKASPSSPGGGGVPVAAVAGLSVGMIAMIALGVILLTRGRSRS
jgi:hypothetical protein